MHKFQKGGRNNSMRFNSSAGGGSPGGSPAVNLVQQTASHLGRPTKTEVLVQGTSLMAVMDLGANISAVHP